MNYADMKNRITKISQWQIATAVGMPQKRQHNFQVISNFSIFLLKNSEREGNLKKFPLLQFILSPPEPNKVSRNNTT